MLGVNVVEGGVGCLVGKAEVLIEREADGTGEGEFVLGEGVDGRDEGLLLVLVVDLGAEDVELGAGTGVMVGVCLVEGDPGGGELSLDGLDAGLVGDA